MCVMEYGTEIPGLNQTRWGRDQKLYPDAIMRLNNLYWAFVFK